MTVATLVKESTPSYTKHDQLFKQLINTFFEEFLEAFFPEVHHYVNFQAIKPLSEEVYTDLIEGKTRRLDIIMETKLKGAETVIIVHVEPQSYVETGFHKRMFHYFSLLYNKYKKPIIPIAVFSYDGKWEENTYTMEFPFFHVLTFNFMTLHLRKKNWRDYSRLDNPVAAALLSKMGYKEEEKVHVKMEFLKMIARMEINPAKQRLIYGFFETYLKLNEEEEEELMEEIKQLKDADKILEIPISYEEKGKKIGKEIGKELGIKEVALEMLKEGASIEFIAKVTHLNKEEIKNLRETL
ncbi:transposase [Lentibacillus populi]|uniref:Transposase n=1 Tax=Lentibacillus populi TaxID=1827502 RepID=A0A9W5TZD4_9BACI|nr:MULTISPECIES: Rpn family recombination-promoting nuclease/putative transposase [Bacillaceae]MBT2217358.1 Rpn family recombination-promoting nuclease/putative transposase [Virgibacillus dakarensis]GGB50855.1 transposase [Lentibacillus populi]